MVEELGDRSKEPGGERYKQFAYGAPASTPSLAEVWGAWLKITEAADPWLDSVTTETLQSKVIMDGKPSEYIWGSPLHGTIYHYWYQHG